MSTEICRKLNMQCMGFAFMEIVRFWSIGSNMVNTLCGKKHNVADFILYNRRFLYKKAFSLVFTLSAC